MLAMIENNPSKSISDKRHLLAQWERSAVRKLQVALAVYGVSPINTVSIWIGLKSKPGVVLYPSYREDLDKIAVDVAATIMDQDNSRWISLQGHPWWANQGPNQSQLIAMQQRLTSIRLRSFLGRASEQEKKHHIALALFRKIGRAELRSFFIDIPRQLNKFGGVLELPWDFSDSPTSFPENLYLIGTLGQDLDVVGDSEVLDYCSIVSIDDLSDSYPSQYDTPQLIDHPIERTLTICRSFDPHRAGNRIPSSRKQDALRILVNVLSLLYKHNVKLDLGIINDAYLQLGHAWDIEGHGLFDSRIEENILIAADFWLMHSVIPRIYPVVNRIPNLKIEGLHFLTDKYPKAERLWRKLWT
jgi:hypothetical protein